MLIVWTIIPVLMNLHETQVLINLNKAHLKEAQVLNDLLISILTICIFSQTGKLNFTLSFKENMLYLKERHILY